MVYMVCSIFCHLLLLSKHSVSPNESKTCLELGAGVGLPSLLLAAMKRQIENPPNSEADLILTDYEDLLLHNLKDSITSQFESETAEEKSSVKVFVEKLDWLDDLKELPGSNCKVVIGSALIYSPDHVACAGVIE
jgi:Lysine methyltransferase